MSPTLQKENKKSPNRPNIIITDESANKSKLSPFSITMRSPELVCDSRPEITEKDLRKLRKYSYLFADMCMKSRANV
jgi:hypothetical protein